MYKRKKKIYDMTVIDPRDAVQGHGGSEEEDPTAQQWRFHFYCLHYEAQDLRIVADPQTGPSRSVAELEDTLAVARLAAAIAYAAAYVAWQAFVRPAQ